MFKYFTMVFMTFSLVSCASLNNGQNQIAYSCAAATSAIQTVTFFKAKLTADQASKIDDAIKIINPVCSSPEQPSYTTAAITELNAAVTYLTDIASEVKK